MILLAFIGSLEFYVIAFAVAIALVALMARPADKGEAQTLFARGVANEPSGEDGIVMTTDSDGRLEWTRHGAHLDTPDCQVNCAITVIDNDIKIIERKADDSWRKYTTPTATFTSPACRRHPGRYHLYCRRHGAANGRPPTSASPLLCPRGSMCICDKNSDIFNFFLTFAYMEKEFVTMNRREWLKRSAAGLTALAVAGAVGGCGDKTHPKRLEGNVRLPAKLPMLERMDDGFTPLAISTMSMPKTGGKMAAEGIKIIQRAADAGVSLFDTAWAYADGDGERMLGEALSNRSRDSFMLSTSMPTFSVDTVAEAKVVFDRQLQLLRTDHVDYYSLQAIGSSDIYKEKYSDSGIPFLTRCDQGKIRHLGIDYIGSDEDFLNTLLSDRRFDFFRLPYNAIDDLRMNGAQSSAIFAAQDAGKLVFATNPTKDGMLRALNGDATDVLYSAFLDRPIAGWALRAAARQEGVATVVDSPSDLTMLAEDVTAMALGTEFSEKESAV